MLGQQRLGRIPHRRCADTARYRAGAPPCKRIWRIEKSDVAQRAHRLQRHAQQIHPPDAKTRKNARHHRNQERHASKRNHRKRPHLGHAHAALLQQNGQHWAKHRKRGDNERGGSRQPPEFFHAAPFIQSISHRITRRQSWFSSGGRSQWPPLAAPRQCPAALRAPRIQSPIRGHLPSLAQSPPP